MHSLPVRIIFSSNSVLTLSIGTSEGQLEYYVLPEGNYSVAMLVTEGKLMIKFYSDDAAEGAIADPQVC